MTTTMYHLALQIPDQYRIKILEQNHVYKAILEFSDPDMMKLWWYYANFIEPSNPQYAYEIKDGKVLVDNNCKVCLGEMLKKWKLIEVELIKIEKEKQLLNAL